MVTAALVALLLPSAAPAFGERLFAANGGGGADSTLYILNPATGAVASTVGAIGFSVTGLAYDPITGVLYGSTGNNSTSPRNLVRIDTTTGAGTLIGPFNTNTPMADLASDAAGNRTPWTVAGTVTAQCQDGCGCLAVTRCTSPLRRRLLRHGGEATSDDHAAAQGNGATGTEARLGGELGASE